MYKKRAFTLIELLIVISVIALLMAILMPALSRAKKQAKALVCRSNLKQWSMFFKLYTADNDDRFSHYLARAPSVAIFDGRGFWTNVLRPYYGGLKKLLCCPIATQNLTSDFHGSKTNAWIARPPGAALPWKRIDPNSPGSYGINSFVYYLKPGEFYHYDASDYWGTTQISGAKDVPMFFDSSWIDSWPASSDAPPKFEDVASQTGSPMMQRVCINRHDGHVNVIFMDFSVRKVGLKELWTLKWAPNYNRKGPYTLAGNAGVPPTWPPWMQRFKNY